MPDGGDTPLKVRVGTPGDVHPVMALAMQGADENGFMEPDPERLLETVWACLNLDHGIIGIIDGQEPGQIEGAILLRIGPPWYGKRQFIEERSIFVHPAYRAAKGGRAKRLAEFAKMTARRLDMKLLIGVLSTERTEAKVRFYERTFGKPAGAFWLFDPREEAAGHETGELLSAPDLPARSA